MRGKWINRRNGIIIGAVLAAYTLMGFLLIPKLVGRQLKKSLKETFNCDAAFESVRFNPYTFQLEIEKFQLSDPDGQRLAALKGFLVNFELSSLFRWAWTFKELKVDSPELQFTIKPDGGTNLDPFLKGNGQDTVQESSAPPRLLFQKISLTSGIIRFSDQRTPTPFSLDLESIDLAVSQMSTLKDRKGQYTLSARTPKGESVQAEGHLSLVPVSIDGHLKVENFQAATGWLFVQDLLNVKQPGGVVTLAADYGLQLQEASPVMMAEHVQLGLEGLALTLEGEEAPIFTLRKLALEEGRFDLAANELKVGNVVLEGPNARVTLKSDGGINLGQMVKVKADEGPKPSADPPMLVLIEKGSIAGGTVVFSDQRTPTPFSLDLESIDLAVSQMSTLKDRKGQYTLSARTPKGESVQAEGQISLVPVSIDGHLKVENFQAATGWLFVQDLLNVKQPGGVVTLAADYGLQFQEASPVMMAEHVQLGLEGLALTLDGEEAPIFTLRKLALEEGRFDLAANELKVGNVVLEGPNARVALKSDGGINLGQMVKVKADEGPKPSADPPMLVLIEKGSIAGGTVVFSDQRGSTPFSIGMDSVELKADGLGNKPGTMGRYGLKAQNQAGETIRSEGTVSLSPVRMNGKMVLENVRVATPWLFLQDQLNIAEPSGTLEASAHYGFDLTQKTDWLTVDGVSLKIKDFSLHLKGEQDPLLALNEVNLVDGRLDLGKRAFTADRFSAQKGIARMMVEESGVFDWERIAREPGTEATSENPEEPNPDAVPWTVELGGVDVADVQVAYTDRSRMNPLRYDLGSVTLHQAVTFKATTPAEVVMDDMRGEILALSLMKEAENEKFLAIQRFSFQGGRLDLQSRSMEMGEIELSDGNARVVFDEKRTLNWAELFASKGAIGRGVERIDAEAAAEGRPWTAKVDTVHLRGFGATIEDRAAGSDASFHMKDMALSLSNLGSELKQPIGFKMALRLEEGGELAATGVYDPSKSKAETNLNLVALSLPAFTPYLRGLAPSLAIDSGQLSCGGDLSVEATEKGPLGLSFTGRLGVQNVGVKESPTGTTLMGIEALEVPQFHFGLAPDKLEIHEARLVGPAAKVVINEDQTVNVIEIFKPRDAGPVKAQETSREQEKAPFPIEIGRIDLKGGSLDFADLSLQPQFRVSIRQLEGAVTHFATRGESPSSVALHGQVNEYGQASIEGELYPLQARKRSEASLKFRNIDMANLTPYSTKFAGYEIRSGKLSLNLQYTVIESKLKGENEIIVDQLVLGERVDRPGAAELPLELAVALLKDSSGKIDIGLPVRGDLNDPKFKLGDLVWETLGNQLKKIVTAPFTFIGRLVKFKGGDLDQILFEPGRWNLSPPEREKLKALADGLKERPQLGIEITGGYQKETDLKALQIWKVRRAIVLRMGLTAPEQGELGKPDFSDPATQKAIEALFVERVSPESLEGFKKTFSEAEAKGKVKEGPPPSKDLTSPQLYEKLYGRLVEIESVSGEDLRQLGQQRAQAASEELEKQGLSDKQRIQVLPSASVTKGKDGLIPTSLKVMVLQAKR